MHNPAAMAVRVQRDQIFGSVREQGQALPTVVFQGLVGGIAFVKRGTHPISGRLWVLAMNMSNKDRCVLVKKDKKDKEAVLQAENRWRGFSNLCSNIDGQLCAWFFDNADDSHYVEEALKPVECCPVAQRDVYLHVVVAEDKTTIKQSNAPELAMFSRH